MAELLLPSHIQRIHPWEAPEALEMNKLLKEGDPTMGWEGEDRLFLQIGEDERWEVWRMCEDNVPRMICRSRPGAKLDKSLLAQLRDNDSRRNDVLKRVDAHNAVIKATADAAMHDKLMEKQDKVYWALSKDLHAHGGY